MTVVRPLDPAAAGRLGDELALLLEDAVAGGASPGFLLTLEWAEVEAYCSAWSKRCGPAGACCWSPSRPSA